MAGGSHGPLDFRIRDPEANTDCDTKMSQIRCFLHLSWSTETEKMHSL